jgi:ATP-dependent protease ClpP protease subunit
MYSYYFDNEITVESVNELVKKLQAVEGEIELWFSTNGGSSSAMTFLISFLNRRKEDVTVVLTNKCYSAGAYILLFFEGRIKIVELDAVLFHLTDREQYTFRKDDYTVNQKILAKQDKEYNLIFAKKIKEKGLLTDKQLKQFLQGRDVVVYKEQYDKWKLK